MVQWLGLHPSTAGGINSIPGWGTKLPYATRCGQQQHTDKIRVNYTDVSLPVFCDFPGSSAGKESAYNVGDPGSIPGLVSSPGEGIGYPLQYSWVSLVAQTVMNPPAMWDPWVGNILWRMALKPTLVFLPGESTWTEEPGRLHSTGLQRVRHD